MAPVCGIIHSRKEGTREEVIEIYHAWILTQQHLLDSLWELKDKTLDCWYPCLSRLCVNSNLGRAEKAL